MSKIFSTTSRIYYQDTDAGGVVYHSKYLDFCERARTEFLRERGIEQMKLVKDEGIMFAVRNLCIDYVSPAKLDDLLEISVEIKEIKGVRIKMEQNILQKNDKQLLAKIKLELVTINRHFKPIRLPEKLKNKLQF